MKSVLSLLICCCLLLAQPAFCVGAKEASEPSVMGPDAIDLLKGGTLDAWQVPSARWTIDKQSIVGSTGTEKLALPEWLYSKQKFGDFEFTCELKLSGDNRRNSGIYFRANPSPLCLRGLQFHTQQQ